MSKFNIEAEGSELILKNKQGDSVIIPKKYRQEVQDMIKDGCHSCIDNLVETLPSIEHYAQDGSVISTVIPEVSIYAKRKSPTLPDIKLLENTSPDYTYPGYSYYKSSDVWVNNNTNEIMDANNWEKLHPNILLQSNYRSDK